MALPVQKPDHRVSIADYLRREETSDVKHEYHDGEVLEMSGGTFNHAAVATNLTVALGVQLRWTQCRPLDSNMRVAIEGANRFVYSDATILCEPPKFHSSDPNRTTLINPRVIFEVLSDSTEAYDRGDKFQRYQDIESLDEYLLLAQDRPVVEGFHRQPDGNWSFQTWRGIEATARVRSVGIDLPLSDLYTGVTLRDESRPQEPLGDVRPE